jgi:nitric oxide reductase subunit B
MTIALLIAGYEQSFIERALEGSTWAGYFTAQNHLSFQNAMVWRLFIAGITFAGFILLVWDLLTIGKGETRKAPVIIES